MNTVDKITAAEMQLDMMETWHRCNELGCSGCLYGNEYHPTCQGVIEGTLQICPYRKAV